MPGRLPALLQSVALGLGLSLCSAVRADVSHADPAGFEITITKQVDASARHTYRALVEQVGSWWDPAHTYSGDSNNLSIEARAGGLFAEQLLGGGSVQHLSVLYADPEKNTLRLSGGLGPLQEHAVGGAMTIALEDSPGGCKLQLVYRVGGYVPGGLSTWAAPVDNVLDGQMQRLKDFAEQSAKQEKTP